MRAQQIVVGWGVGVGVAVLALTVGLAGAATRFVAPTGSNGGRNTCHGLLGSACQTITFALTQAAPGDTISVAAGTYNLALGETFPLTINQNLTLIGAGAGSTIIDATGANTRVITVNSGVTATITGVTITGGHVKCTGLCNANGGGLLNDGGTLTLTNSTVSGNTASCTISGTGGSCHANGGGLLNDEGPLTLTNSTVSGNTAICTSSGLVKCFAIGGGVYNIGTLPSFVTLTNSTVSGNTATCTSDRECHVQGGGVFNSVFTPSFVTLTNSTVSANTATCTGPCNALGGGLMMLGPLTLTNSTVSGNTVSSSNPSFAVGGGLFNNVAGTTTLQNTIVAKQLAGADCAGDTINSNGFNLDSDNSCQLTQPGDKPNVSDPLLGPLQDNGGLTTQTHALLAGSPAIDAGDNAGCPPTDQGGFRRPVDGNNDGTATCDIGAVERVTVATTLLGAVLPTERTALVGGTAVTAFGTILNTGALTATGCAIAPFTPVAATFTYQALPGGAPDTPVNIPAGQGQNYVFAFTPTAAFPRTDVKLSFACTNSAPAPSTPVSTFGLRATVTPAPDPVAIVAVGPPNDGILRLASAGAFAVATINLGAASLMTVTADTGGVALSLTLNLCETNPQSGLCLADPTPSVQTQMNEGATQTFGVFADSGNQPIAFGPTNNRIRVHFEGGGGGGGTGVAVCTQPLCPPL